jgi:hypothetical protein
LCQCSQLLVAIVEGHSQFIRADDCLAQDIAAQSVEAARRGIHHHQTLRGKGAGNELREGLA